MSEFNKYSTDGGATFIDVEDSKAVHYGDQSKGYVEKNLCPNKAYNRNNSGVICTVYDDGTIELNGTNTASSNISFEIFNHISFPAGDYILSGCPSGGSYNSFWLNVHSNSLSLDQNDIGNGVSYSWDASSDTRLLIHVKSGAVIDHKVFKPMITKSNIPDSDYAHYEPYIPSNVEIMNKVSFTNNAVLGSKNICDNTMKTHTNAGISFTRNADGSITIDADSSQTGTPGELIFDGVIPAGNYIFSTHETSQGNDIHYFIAALNGSTYVRNITEIQNYDNQPFTIDYSDYDRIRVGIWIRAGKAIDNKRCYPMIRLADDNDPTYYPYAMTNATITTVVGNTLLSSTDDADNIKTEGVYSWGSSVPTNIPSEAQYGVMIVKSAGGAWQQLVFRANYILQRNYGGGNWSSWYKIQGTEVS